MKRLILIIVIVAALFTLANANPLMPVNISEYSTSPPWIEITCLGPDTVDLSGLVVHTMSSDVIVNNGVKAYNESIVLDSSNTSGFVFNPDGDSIVIAEYWLSIGFGCRGNSAPPVTEESAAWTHWHNAQLNFCMYPSPGGWAEVPYCDWGNTQVIINEVNINCDWDRDCNFIELYNRSDMPVDISGWQIVGNTRYWIPSYTTIAPHGYYVIDQVDAPLWFGLSAGCDNVYLLKNTEQLVDQTGWTSDHGPNVSFMRYPNGGPDTMTWGQYMGYSDETSVGFIGGFPSRMAFNRSTNPGLKVIGATAEISGNYVNIYWTNPVWFSTYQTTILRMDTTGFPQTPFDGELMMESIEQEYLFDHVAPGQTAYYTLFARTSCGDYSVPDSESQVSVYMPLVGVDVESPIPERPALLECYPNPFNSSITIRHSAGLLVIYSITGQVVAEFPVSSHSGTVTWNAAGIPSGIYFARLESEGAIKSVKLTLLK